MAKVVIAGDALVVTSSLKLEDIKTIAKYRPKELILLGGEDNKEPIFALGVTKGAGSINNVGVSFSKETYDDKKLATLTININSGDGVNPVDWVADQYGAAIMHLNKIEAKLPAVLESIAKEKAAVVSSITMA